MSNRRSRGHSCLRHCSKIPVSYGCLQCCGQECPQLLRFAFSRYFFSFDILFVWFAYDVSYC